MDIIFLIMKCYLYLKANYLLIMKKTISTIRKTVFYFILSIIPFLSKAQDTKAVEAITSKFNYTRPSLSEVYFMGNISEEKTIFEGFSKLKKLADDRADHNNLNLPKIENSMGPDNEGYQKFVSSSLQKYFNQIVSMWWGRDASGNMGDAFIKQRGNYTATDGQVVQDQSSEISRIGDLGYKLIEKSYIIVYDIISVQNMEDFYDEKDAAKKKEVEDYNRKAQEYNKKLKSGEKARELRKFEPVKRVKQGWKIGYKCSLYKLKWNTEIQDDFFNNLWVDKSTVENRSQRIQAFNSKNFPFELVKQWQSSTDETKRKLPTDPVNSAVLNALLLGAGESVQYLAMSNLQSNIDDFKLRANIHSAYPIKVKLGTKESLEKETRYFVYEVAQNRKGETVKKRVGWTFVTKVADNKKTADGEMPTSKFKQHGGKKLYSGMLIEEDDDFGVAVTLSNNFGNRYFQGFNLGLEANTSKIISLIPGLYLGVNLSIGSSKDISLGHLTLTDKTFTDSISPTEQYVTNIIADSTKKYSTSSFGLNVTLGKEIYIFRGLYLYPLVGFGLNSFSIDKRDGKEIAVKQDLDSSPFNFSGLTTFGAMRVGYNILPWLNVFGQVSFYSNKGMMSNDYGKITQSQVNRSSIVNTFRSAEKGPLLFGAGIRFRL